MDINCKFCNSNDKKINELALDTLLLCQLTKYKYLSELIKIENESHCVQQFAHLIETSKEPYGGTQRGPFVGIKKILGL